MDSELEKKDNNLSAANSQDQIVSESSGKNSVKFEFNLLSAGAVVIIVVLSILVGSLWAINSSSNNISPNTVSVTAGQDPEVTEIQVWNATIRSSVADVLGVLSLQDLADISPDAPASERDYIFYRMCRDIQGFYKNLNRSGDAPNPQIDLLYKDWSNSVQDLANDCKTVTPENINVEEIDRKVAKTWLLFDSFVIGMSPYLEELPATPEGARP